MEIQRKTKKRDFYFFASIVLSVFFLFACKSIEEKTVSIDLLNPLVDSELFWDTNYIDVGAAVFHGALVGGWNRDRRESGGITFARATSKNSYILFYVFEPSDRTIDVKCKGVSTDQRLFLSVNGNSLGSRQIETGYQVYSFPVPRAFLRPGKNMLEVYGLLPDRSRSSVLFDEISFRGSRETQNDEGGFLRIFETSPEESSTNSAIRAAVPSAIVEYLLIPKSASLEVDYQLPGKMSGSVAAQIEVHIADQEKRRHQLSSNILRNGLFSSHWRKESMSLKDFENRIVELKLQALAVAGSSAPDYIDWTRVSLKVNSTGHEQLHKNQGSANFSIPKPSNIIIYVIGSLRKDHLQPYGYKHSTSLFISEFAKDSVVFKNAYSQSPVTRASIASIFTGLHPSSHGTEGSNGLFSDETTTIASELKMRGFTTYGFVTNINISNTFGFGKDYDQYTYYGEDQATKGLYVTSDTLYEHLNTFLKQRLREPALIYIHAVDPHEPFRPEPNATIPASCKEDVEEIHSAPSGLYARECNPRLKECLTVLYDTQVGKSDYYFGQFLKRLKNLGIYEDSLIILTSDHGQSFCEHRNLQNARSLYQPEIRVPLIVKLPGKKFAGKEIHEVARHIDLLPTILEAAGTQIPDFMEGQSLFNLLQDRSDGSLPAFAELNTESQRKKAFVFETWKLIETRGRLEYEPERYELYDISKDPDEKMDLSTRDPILLGYVRKMYRQFSRIYFKPRFETGRREASIDKNTEETLRALGYLQ